MSTELLAAEAASPQTDRRQHQRIQLQNHHEVLLRADDVHALSVADICLGGIAFTYQGHKEWPETPLSMDFQYEDLHLSDVQVKIVWDTAVPAGASGHGADVRRCGLKFIHLEPEQESVLCDHIAKAIAKLAD